jgi:hypothetical protein
MNGSALGILLTSKKKLLAGACSVALAIGGLLRSPASAATYLVSNDAQLRAAITAANGDGDPNALIQMTAAFSIGVSALPVATKPITIDTHGFPSEPLAFSGLGAQVILIGTFQGAAGATGERGVNILSQASVINNASITGGDGGGSSQSGVGANLSAQATLVNNGTIRGGGSGGQASGGNGAQIAAGSTLINNGLMEGGDGQGVISKRLMARPDEYTILKQAGYRHSGHYGQHSKRASVWLTKGKARTSRTQITRGSSHGLGLSFEKSDALFTRPAGAGARQALLKYSQNGGATTDQGPMRARTKVQLGILSEV